VFERARLAGLGQVDQGGGGLGAIIPCQRIQELDKPRDLYPDAQVGVAGRAGCQSHERAHGVGANRLVVIQHGVLEVVGHGPRDRRITQDVDGDGALAGVVRLPQDPMQDIGVVSGQMLEGSAVAVCGRPGGIPGACRFAEIRNEVPVDVYEHRRQADVTSGRLPEPDVRRVALLDPHVEDRPVPGAADRLHPRQDDAWDLLEPLFDIGLRRQRIARLHRNGVAEPLRGDLAHSVEFDQPNARRLGQGQPRGDQRYK